MAFKIDFKNGFAYEWSKSGEKVIKNHREYKPTIFVSSDRERLIKNRVRIQNLDLVHSTKLEKRYTDLKKEDKSDVLKLELRDPYKCQKAARKIDNILQRGSTRFYNVDFSPQFRYCIENNIDPSETNQLSKAKLSLDKVSIENKDVSGLRIDGLKLDGRELDVLEKLRIFLEKEDPDVLVVNQAALVGVLKEKIDAYGLEFSLGRVDGWRKLAGDNTVSCYGKTVYSSARYNIPGRVLVYEDNSFMFGKTGIEGMLDLVERSWKPLQELAWASIGNILTGIKIRKAFLDRNVLIPWKNWRHEKFKTASTMYKADRGGHIFSPRPGIYQNVYEIDFASMYPNIMVNENISPETLFCECCENNKVPELGYSICEKREGLIKEVLEPIVESRENYKEQIRNGCGNEEELRERIGALKWILVSCFGYMGFKNAKFGSIECHQAINAFAREIMMESKQSLEANDWKIVHGIIDSLWVKNSSKDKNNLESVCKSIEEDIGIRLDYEDYFEWIAFVSNKDSNVGSLNRYFGKNSEGNYVYAGIECEQSSTCDFVKKSQKEFITSLENNFDFKDVISCLKKKINELENNRVSNEELLINNKVSKSLEDYKVKNSNYYAIKTYKEMGVSIKPGQEVNYIIKNKNHNSVERVVVEENIRGEIPDKNFYKKKLIKAGATVASPLGKSERDIKKRLYNDSVQTTL